MRQPNLLVILCIWLISYSLAMSQSSSPPDTWRPLVDTTTPRQQQANGSLKPGYYLILVENNYKITELLKEGWEMVRKLDQHHFIAHATGSAGPINSNQINSWNVNHKWKLAPYLLNTGPKDKTRYTIVLQHSSRALPTLSTIEDLQILSARDGLVDIYTSKETLMTKVLPMQEVLYIGTESLQTQEETRVIDLNINPNTINQIHHAFPQLNGDGMTISIQELLFNPSDIDLIGRNVPSDLGAREESDHATEMATIAAGAGNSFITGKGVAWTAGINSSDFSDIFPDPNASYQSLDITVQNHSYGTKIENFYGGRAMLFDQSANDNPGLLHVFSSGNLGLEGDTIGVYKGVVGLANLTGNYKMAKNILVVGSVDTVGRAVSFASKGPAHDGRIKPEVVAYSTVGSSNSAALVSGLSLLLQQEYKNAIGGQLPSALTKALIINSATDVGTPQVDHATGYGNVDGFRALNNLRQGQYISDHIDHGETKTYTLNPPVGAINLKATLVWNDPVASANTNIALINDLDLTISDAGSKVFQPWVLNTNADSLDLVQPAKRGEDHLNNVEQVTIEAPDGGSYTIHVNGFDIPQGSQTFYIAYQWDLTDSFGWTFPTASDNFPYNGETTSYFRWNSTMQSATGQLEYSTDNGASWMLISANINLARGHFRWEAPQITSPAIARMTIGSQTFITETFTISRPARINVGFNCADSVLLQWNDIPNATGYELFTLGDANLESVLTTSDTSIIVRKNDFPTSYFTMQPILSDGIKPVKSVTFDYNSLGTSCYLISFFPSHIAEEGVTLRTELGTTFEVAEVVFERMINNSFVPIGSVVQFDSLIVEFLDPAPIQGLNTYRTAIRLKNGVELTSELAETYFLTEKAFLLFPNPVSRSENLFVFSKDFVGQTRTMTLYDRYGKILKTGQLISERDFISISELVPGMYFYSIEVGGKEYRGKVIVR